MRVPIMSERHNRDRKVYVPMSVEEQDDDNDACGEMVLFMRLEITWVVCRENKMKFQAYY